MLFAQSSQIAPPQEKLSDTEALAKCREFESAMVEAAKTLTAIGVRQGNAIGINTSRSTQQNHTDVVAVTTDQLGTYLNRIEEISSEIKKYEWPEKHRPKVFADLRALIIQGEKPLIISAAHDIDLSHSSLFAQTSLTAKGTKQNIHLTETYCANDITLIVDKQADVNLKAKRVKSHKRFMIALAVNARGGTAGLDFERAEFNGPIEIQGRLSIDLANFTEAKFSEKVNFSLVSFGERVSFFESKFQKETIFSRCNFQYAPNFHGTNFHPSTHFSNCKFDAAGTMFSRHCRIEDVASYRVLKSHFAKQRDGKQELFFYALEQRGERMLTRGEPVEFVLSWLYDLVSSYGTSSTRAFLWLTGWNVCFAGLLGSFGAEWISTDSKAFTNPGVALALQNAFNPLALFSEKGLVKITSGLVYALSLTQALGSLGMLALFFLAIRGRFRKGGGGEN